MRNMQNGNRTLKAYEVLSRNSKEAPKLTYHQRIRTRSQVSLGVLLRVVSLWGCKISRLGRVFRLSSLFWSSIIQLAPNMPRLVEICVSKSAEIQTAKIKTLYCRSSSKLTWRRIDLRSSISWVAIKQKTINSKSNNKLLFHRSKIKMITSKHPRRLPQSRESRRHIAVVTITVVTTARLSFWVVKRRWCRMEMTIMSSHRRIQPPWSLKVFWKCRTLLTWWRTIRRTRGTCRMRMTTIERGSMMKVTSSTEMEAYPLRRKLGCFWWRWERGIQVSRNASICRSRTLQNLINHQWAIDHRLNCTDNRQWKTWRGYMWAFLGSYQTIVTTVNMPLIASHCLRHQI